MHSKRSKLFSLLIISLMHITYAGQKTLCFDTEETLFSCTLTNGKQVSLCGTQNNELQTTLINYKFGRLNHIELDFPSNKIKDNSLFYYAKYHRYQTEYFYVTFQNKTFKYEVFRYYDASISDEYKAGVSVVNTKNDKRYESQCKTIHENSLNKVADYVELDPEPDF